MLKKSLLVVLTTVVGFISEAQENSPYSRYGIGDLVPNQHIANRGMGGISIAYSDYGLIGSPLNINLVNPAFLGSLTNTRNFSNTIYDFGAELDFRTIKSSTTADKYASRNLSPSYLQVAFPVSTKKMEKNGLGWGVAFGLTPISRINYKIESFRRDPAVDSINSLYEGTGGISQFNLSTGFRKTGKGKYKNDFLIGVSSGLTFGNKDISTKTAILNDSVQFSKSDYQLNSRFRGVFVKTGFQYAMNLKRLGVLRLGAYVNLEQQLTAKQNIINQTFDFDYSGGVIKIDSIYSVSEIKGTMVLPMRYGFGFTYQTKNKKWLIGSDFEQTQFTKYRYYDASDFTADMWTLRVGLEYYPSKVGATNKRYVEYLKYRAGFYIGPDYIKINDTRNNLVFTGGLSMPLTTPRSIQTRGEYVTLNTSFEIGSRGANVNSGVKENITRFNFGIAMNARWFQKRSYD